MRPPWHPVWLFFLRSATAQQIIPVQWEEYKPDPCNPYPCGPGTFCSVSRSGNAICTCDSGLIPKPDTITGCGPECVGDPDCQRGFICQTGKCVEKPDLCDPSLCGPGAECSVTSSGRAICRCQAGLIPNPDTIFGCKQECVIDPDCQRGYICLNQKCFQNLGLGIQVPSTRRTIVANKRRPTTTRSRTVPTKRRTTSSIILESMKKSCGHRPPIDLTVAVNEGQVNAPFAVSIGKYFQNEFKHHCTGSVLAPEIILSAAHCITSQYFDRESFKIRAGVEHLESHHAVERKIRKAVFHSQWQRSGRNNIYFDICLIFLESPLPFTPSIQPICLPIQTFHSLPASKVGDGITTVGWGRDNEDVVGKEITQIDVTVRTNDECNFKYKHTDRRDKIRLQRELPNLLTASQFCADNNANKGIGTCHGDSGGPSFIRNFENGMEKFTIFGVTSGSISCGGGLPDFYTFVAQEEILPWIHKAASEDEQTRSEFNHLRDNSWVHCEIDTECAYGKCNDGVCIQTLTLSEAHSIGPSSKCPDDKKPCYVGNECTSAVCNRYGNSCWCPQNKRKRSAEKNIEKENIPKEMSFVTGKPYQWDIECKNDGDCPIDWFCEELFCYAPLTFPSAAWEALSAPVVGRIGTLTASAPLGSVSPNCLCKPDCTSPICNSLNRCWCAAKGWGVPRHG